MSTEIHAFAYLTGKNAPPHIPGMDYRGVIRSVMKAGKVNQQQLAKRLKVTQPTVSRWLKGTRPDHDQHDRIVAEAVRLGVMSGALVEPSFEADAPDDKTPLVVRVVGYVGAGAAAHFYAVAQGELDEVPAPDGATPDTVAVEIRGNSLGELFDRWLVFYDQVRRPVTSDLLNRLCVVGLPDDRVLVKKIRRNVSGRFDLYSNLGEDPIRDVDVDWAARVKNMVPR